MNIKLNKLIPKNQNFTRLLNQNFSKLNIQNQQFDEIKNLKIQFDESKIDSNYKLIINHKERLFSKSVLGGAIALGVYYKLQDVYLPSLIGMYSFFLANQSLSSIERLYFNENQESIMFVKYTGFKRYKQEFSIKQIKNLKINTPLKIAIIQFSPTNVFRFSLQDKQNQEELDKFIQFLEQKIIGRIQNSQKEQKDKENQKIE
ncbi:hypothetical protein PPERSA_12491 [Pseudocohnilembus persalinus]|uniref:Uncharacterized protein n=1 Tax=Pseudocohnilembus persalinus TaxID=266149 RepID=A0A0V0QPD3_PSEPJ|nr:hypothetical protein PPERSA_12491 [Pseudocohnilembus persalinus]|eukprot:KRX04044.1 hypothetical protein PPERSA_12491 [Pseudocohnilembus persalinus]